ncbi:MAG: hypothetical protein U1F24_00605 [Alphaproteobacteria bacterium]
MLAPPSGDQPPRHSSKSTTKVGPPLSKNQVSTAKRSPVAVSTMVAVACSMPSVP